MIFGICGPEDHVHEATELGAYRLHRRNRIEFVESSQDPGRAVRLLPS
jgi:hypothetical protein